MKNILLCIHRFFEDFNFEIDTSFPKIVSNFFRLFIELFIFFQALFEKLGKTSRTVDTELESQIENLRDTQRKYGNVLRLARALTSHFYHVIQTQVST